MVSSSGFGILLADPPKGSCLPRQARLTKPTEFKRVFNRPIVSADRMFKVLARRSNGPNCRLGMAVSRQVDKRAVGRNRIKRVIRESFRQHLGDMEPAVDFVVLPRSESATISNWQLRHSLDKHWARILARLQDAPAEQ